MKKVLKTFSLTVIFLFVLSVFGWMTFHISQGDKKFGFLEGPVKFMYTFLDLFSQSVEEVKTLPGTFVKTPNNFKSINKLDTDLVVISTYSDTSDTRSIVLRNLKNDSVIYKWNVENEYKEYDRIINPLLLPKKNLIYSFAGKELRRIDSLANIVWKQDSIDAHHSMNIDSDGNIWICSFAPVYFATGLYKIDGRSVFYKDNYITEIDAETGRILFHKSVTKILKENNLSSYILKSDNIEDPIHINDIEPVLKTTKYYKKGDLFISARCPSIIIHYRPSLNKVIKIIEGAFISQHDVDIINDSSLVIFNNNFYTLWSNKSKSPPIDSSKLEIAGDFYSNIIRYDLWNDSFSFLGDSIFRVNKIFTATEGLIEFLNPSTYFVEEQNKGVLWIIKDDKVIYKDVYKSQHEGYHHLSNWTRIIKKDD